MKSKEVKADIVISPLADEPLISDILAGELEIAVEDFAKGLWRFRWEPKEKVRISERKGLVIKLNYSLLLDTHYSLLVLRARLFENLVL